MASCPKNQAEKRRLNVELDPKQHSEENKRNDQDLYKELRQLQTKNEHLTQEVERLKEDMKTLSEIVGTGVIDPAEQQITLSGGISELLSRQQQMYLELSQQILQQKQNCANCSEMEVKYGRLKDQCRQLQKQNQEYIQQKRHDEMTIHNLQSQLYSEECERVACKNLRKAVRQKELQAYQGNPGKDVDKQTKVEHDQVLLDYEKLTTEQEGLLGVLEENLKSDDACFEAKRLLCALFQEAYNESRKVVIHEITAKLKSLFSVQSKTEEMEDASRGYGMLLHACGLTTQEKRASHCKAIKAQLFREFSDEGFLKVKETLKSSSQDHLGKAIELAWKFVALPNPLIAYQPKKFNEHIHQKDFYHWDDEQMHTSKLIYIGPVVYRNYEGGLAYKGWVANKVIGK